MPFKRQTLKPKILVTTSRTPSLKLRSFVNELVRAIPNSIRVQRGKKTFEDLYVNLKVYGADRLVVIGDWRGNPRVFTVYTPVLHRASNLLFEKILEFKIKGVTLLREVKRLPSNFNPKTLGVNVFELEEELLDFAEKISKSLHAILVYDPSLTEKCDVLVEIRECIGCLLKLVFLEPKSGEYVGPIIKVEEWS